ncbi:MAG: ester cyclase [Gemmatimonadaceae bacterium]
MPTLLTDARAAARLAAVDEHARAENSHDLDRLMDTFGDRPVWDDRSANERHDARDGVRTYYAELFAGFPDFGFDIEWRHVAADAVILEVTVRGMHTGAWKGIAPTGRRVEFPVCAVFTFDETNRIQAETVYFDRMTVLSQLGVM